LSGNSVLGRAEGAEGGAVWVGNTASAFLQNDTLMNNIASSSSGVASGGGVWAGSGSAITIASSVLQKHMLEGAQDVQGGGVWLGSNARANISFSQILSGTLNQYLKPAKGGGIYAGSGSAITLTETLVNGNMLTTTTSYLARFGGGIFLDANAAGVINGGEVSYNAVALGNDAAADRHLAPLAVIHAVGHTQK
jgi:hypothetical protein